MRHLRAKFKSERSLVYSYWTTWLNILDPTTLRPLTTPSLFKQFAASLETRVPVSDKLLLTASASSQHMADMLSQRRLTLAYRLLSLPLNIKCLKKSMRRKLKQLSSTMQETTLLQASEK
jgi:hypothetical protein